MKVICQKDKVASRLDVWIRCQVLMHFWTAYVFAWFGTNAAQGSYSRWRFPPEQLWKRSGNSFKRREVWAQRRSKCVLSGSPWECLSAVRPPRARGNSGGRVGQTVERDGTSVSKHALTACDAWRGRLTPLQPSVSAREKSRVTATFIDCFNYRPELASQEDEKLCFCLVLVFPNLRRKLSILRLKSKFQK